MGDALPAAPAPLCPGPLPTQAEVDASTPVLRAPCRVGSLIQGLSGLTCSPRAICFSEVLTVSSGHAFAGLLTSWSFLQRWQSESHHDFCVKVSVSLWMLA